MYKFNIWLTVVSAKYFFVYYFYLFQKSSRKFDLEFTVFFCPHVHTLKSSYKKMTQECHDGSSLACEGMRSFSI